jgi:hypothetical protein
MVVVDTALIPDPEEDEETACHPQGKAEYVQKAISFVFPEISEGYFEEVL